MTQRVLIVNLGDEPLTLTQGNSECATQYSLFPRAYVEKYVWSGNTIEISEKNSDCEKTPQ